VSTYNYILDELVAYLSTFASPPLFSALGSGSNFFVGIIPDTPDVVTTLFEYEGKEPQYVMGNSSLPAITKPHLQVLCRDITYQNSRDQCESVVRILEQVTNQSIKANVSSTPTLYYRIERIQDPFLFHRDSRRRVYFACNMAVQRQPS